MITRAARTTTLLTCVLLSLTHCAGTPAEERVQASEQAVQTTGHGISVGYTPPSSKVGIADWYWLEYPESQPARYAKLAQLGVGLKTYNAWWYTFERDGAPPSSSDPNLACPQWFHRVPANETERIQKGFKRYRCIADEFERRFDVALTLDAQYGIQSAVAAYNAPPTYRDPGCVGMPFPAPDSAYRDGCVPRDDAEDDWEDYINYLASRYNGRNGVGKITHFILWNEVGAATWFNYTPRVPRNWMGLSDAEKGRHLDAWLGKIVRMMHRAHAAIERHDKPALLEISLDPVVYPSLGDAPNMGAKAVIDGLWLRLWDLDPRRIDWSIAMHPYGVPTADMGPWINYAKLGTVVDYQVRALAARGAADAPYRPQAIVLASEQGWQSPITPGNPESVSFETRALYMCQAHDIEMGIPQVLGSTHNVFQSWNDAFALIPASPENPNPTLEGVEAHYAWWAYQSMAPGNWGRTRTHACCVYAGIGCGP